MNNYYVSDGMKRQTIFTAIFFLLVSCLQAQTISLSVSNKTIGSQDDLRVTYSINGVNNDQDISPNFTDWNVVGNSSSSSTVIKNNQVSSGISYTFILTPTRIGKLIVPGISINDNGKIISCNSTAVEVLSKPHVHNNNNHPPSNQSPDPFQQMQQMQRQMQQQMSNMFGDNMDNDLAQQQHQSIILHRGETLENAVKNNIFIRIVPSKTTCYLGEPISVDYEVYSNVYCTASPVHIPSFGSFSVTDVNQSNGMYSTQFNGKNYRAQTIRKAQLIALKIGDLLLDSASLSCQVYYTDEYDPGNQKVGTVIIKSAPMHIHVLPLPDKNKPKDFSGAVGNFNITASVDKNSLPAQENNVLHIQIIGTGTLDNVTLPTIDWPSDVQSYDSKDSQSIDKSAFPMQVTRSFDVPFIGNEEGTTIIPAIKFSYFDTKKNDYLTISTDSIKLAFGAPIANNTKLENSVIKNSGNKKYLWIVLAVGVLVLIYYFVKSRLSKQYKQNKKVDAKPSIQNKMEDNSQQENDEDVAIVDKKELLQEKKNKLNEAFAELQNESDNYQFFILAKALLIQYLQDKLEDNSINENELLQHLEKAYPDEIGSIESLLARCNKALYMPAVSAIEREEVLKRLKLLLHTFIYSVNL